MLYSQPPWVVIQGVVPSHNQPDHAPRNLHSHLLLSLRKAIDELVSSHGSDMQQHTIRLM